MNYLNLLNNSYLGWKNNEIYTNKYEFLCSEIFDITTYSSTLDKIFTKQMLEVCLAISNRTTFDYIDGNEDKNYIFITMCNLPFLMSKINWGSSIRGAFWDSKGLMIPSFCIWADEKQQFKELSFTLEEWKLFIIAMDEFILEDIK